MDDNQTAFATQYPSYAFDIDMMKVCILLMHIRHCLKIPLFSALWTPLAVLMLKKRVGPLPLPFLVRTMALPSRTARTAMLSRITAMDPRPVSPNLRLTLPRQTAAHSLAVPYIQHLPFPSTPSPMETGWPPNSVPTMLLLRLRSSSNSSSSSSKVARTVPIMPSMRTICWVWECLVWECWVHSLTMVKWATLRR